MKSTFSQRNGFTETRKNIQKESMDKELKTALWNFLHDNFLINSEQLCKNIWGNFLSHVIHDYNSETFIRNFAIRLFDGDFKDKWFKVYDLIEFVAEKSDTWTEKHTEQLNNILENFCSAYLMVNNRKIAEITAEEEIKEIETAINSPIKEIKTHFETALNHFSRRQDHDYRNSIKESICAVECICRKITKRKGLGKAIKALEGKGLYLNSQFKQSIINLYSYTSGEGGIRHPLMDDNEKPKMEEARFMLVACSAFVNYFSVKADKFGIELK